MFNLLYLFIFKFDSSNIFQKNLGHHVKEQLLMYYVRCGFFWFIEHNALNNTLCVHVKCVFIVRDCNNILCRRKRNEKNVHNMLTSHIRAIYPKIDKDPWIAHCKWNFPYSFWNVVKDFIIQSLLFPIKKDNWRIYNRGPILKITMMA